MALWGEGCYYKLVSTGSKALDDRRQVDVVYGNFSKASDQYNAKIYI